MAGYRAPKLADGSVAAGKTKADFAQSLLRGGSRQLPRVGEAGGLVMPAIPTISFLFGQGSSANLSLAAVALMTTSQDTATFELSYTWQNSAFGQVVGLLFNEPVGWKIGMHSVSSVNLASGQPVPIGKNNGTLFYFTVSSADQYRVNMIVTVVKP